MNTRWQTLLRFVVLMVWGLGGSAARAGELWKLLTPVTAPLKAEHRAEGHPSDGKDHAIEELANQIDWIEHHLDKYGTIVAKQPDVWGESRLTRHREEYEQQMAAQLGSFDVNYQAAIIRSDQAFLGFAMALSSAAGSATPGNSATNATTATATMISTTTGSNAITDTAPFNAAAVNSGSGSLPGFGAVRLQLEPTMRLNEMSRYINHLDELRRINEGDDTKDAPGYSLNLVRIPISVIPGKQTREGCGAEITITATPYITRELLPVTFRNMVTNDLVDLLAPTLTEWVNNADVVHAARNAVRLQDAATELAALAKEAVKLVPGPSLPSNKGRGKAVGPLSDTRHIRTQALMMDVADTMPQGSALREQFENTSDPSQAANLVNAQASSSVRDLGGALAKYAIFRSAGASGIKTRRSYQPIPPSQIQEVFGDMIVARMIVDVHDSLVGYPPNRRLIHLTDVRGLLDEELNAAYTFLGKNVPLEPDSAPLPPGGPSREYWTPFCTRDLFKMVRERQVRTLMYKRNEYLRLIGTGGMDDGRTLAENSNEPAPYDGIGDPVDSTALHIASAGARAASVADNRGSLDPHNPHGFAVCHTMTAGLGWGILIESSLLNEQLNDDYREVVVAKGCAGGCPTDGYYNFFFPLPNNEARDAFANYVRCRWPIRVFALDPVVDQQNIEDSFARRRETQIALAMGFASGQISAQTLLRMTHRLEWDMQTIALNQTVAGFSHGDDTFGWRFYPRFQTPPIKGNAQTLWESVAGGPTTDADMRKRQLEPGMRECTAIVIMPAFVPYVTFDTHSQFFHLTNPKMTEESMRQTLELSRSIKQMQTSAAQCAQCAGLYRDGEVDRMLRRVYQLDRALPMQTMQVQVPYENTAGGFELFNRGITDLAPELLGWYGAPGIDPAGGTVLFLIGKGFSVTGMQTVIGGRAANGTTLLSRQVMRVEVPGGVEVVPDGKGNEFADVHIATPYGVSDHLLVPIARTAELFASGEPSGFTFEAGQSLVFSYSNAASGNNTTAFAPQYYRSPNYLAIHGPVLPLSPQSINVTFDIVSDGQSLSTAAAAAASAAPATFALTQNNRYVLSATDLDALALQLQKAITPYASQWQSQPEHKVVVRGEIRTASDGKTPLPRPVRIGGQFEVILKTTALKP